MRAVACPARADRVEPRRQAHRPTDIPLTEHGEDEARALAPLLARLKPARVLCSPRTRALQTAELGGMRVDAIDDDLAEWDYGDYEEAAPPAVRTM